MSEIELLQAEVARLRSEVEAYKQREIENLKTRLSAAEQAAAHFKTEAERNANTARQIHALYMEETSRLKTALQSHQQVPNTRKV